MLVSVPEVIDPVKIKDTAPAINLYSLDSTRLGTIVEPLTYVTTWAESLGSGSYPWTVQSLFKLFPFLS